MTYNVFSGTLNPTHCCLTKANEGQTSYWRRFQVPANWRQQMGISFWVDTQLISGTKHQ